VREIVHLARNVKADLVVVGAVEGGTLHRLLLGSTAEGVIRKASCPVLAVHAASAFPPARVEIPVDLSPLSANALRHGLRFLARLGVTLAETEALLVLNPSEVGGSLHFTREQIERFASAELRRFLEENGAGAAPRLSAVRIGDAREVILAVLAQRQVDLAILGTHGRTGLDRLTLGSVAAEVMHDAGCNLLVIPPRASLEAEVARREEELQGADWTFVSDEVQAAPPASPAGGR
jgi:nucleotide-binding universal stress UspA family protein